MARLVTLYSLQLRTISSRLVGQAVCDKIDKRHKSILPSYIRGGCDQGGVRRRAAEESRLTARAARTLGG